ncbi:transposable element Tc1 transposase [Trichonephila clavipes]|nr:transposable element Tc1 transposase [Trichonephila clavipes]
MQRSLHRICFGSRQLRSVQLLKSRHRAARLSWSKEHRDWSVKDSKRVACNEDSGFRLLNTDGRLRIGHQAYEVLDPACQDGIVQGHGGSFMVCDVFSWHSLGSLVRVPTFFDAIRYVESLGYNLHLFMLFCYPYGNRVFQQDNCIYHKTRLTTDWLDEHSSDFSVINWTPRNPDLYPIENLLDVFQQGGKGHLTSPTNLTELWTALVNIWRVINRSESLIVIIESHRTFPETYLIYASSRGSHYEGQRRPNSFLGRYP